MDTRTKIITAEQAVALGSERLLVAAGRFDVLHAGHIHFLRRIRSDSAPLLVVVYDDASLGKPVLPERARAQLVAALAGVDYVIVWPQTDLDSLLNRLAPARVEHAPEEERNIIGEVLEKHATS